MDDSTKWIIGTSVTVLTGGLGVYLINLFLNRSEITVDYNLIDISRPYKSPDIQVTYKGIKLKYAKFLTVSVKNSGRKDMTEGMQFFFESHKSRILDVEVTECSKGVQHEVPDLGPQTGDPKAFEAALEQLKLSLEESEEKKVAELPVVKWKLKTDSIDFKLPKLKTNESLTFRILIDMGRLKYHVKIRPDGDIPVKYRKFGQSLSYSSIFSNIIVMLSVLSALAAYFLPRDSQALTLIPLTLVSSMSIAKLLAEIQGNDKS